MAQWVTCKLAKKFSHAQRATRPPTYFANLLNAPNYNPTPHFLGDKRGGRNLAQIGKKSEYAAAFSFRT